MVPLMIGLSVLLVKVNQAIQMGIVNQQYARAQALFLTMGSPVYPRVGLRDKMAKLKYNQMLMGVQENSPGTEEQGTRSLASIAKLTDKPGGSIESGTDDVTERSEVRIRSTVTLCTQTNVVNVAGGFKPVLELELVRRRLARAAGTWQLFEGSVFDYCSSTMRYL